MSKRHYDEARVVASLKKKPSIRFEQIGFNKAVVVTKNATDIGIRSWGKIDYLVHYCGYFLQMSAVSKPSKEDKNPFSSFIENNKKIIKKVKQDIKHNNIK